MMKFYNRDEVFRSWWGPTITMRSYTHGAIWQRWWGLTVIGGLTITMMSGNHDILQSWGLTILMRSYDPWGCLTISVRSSTMIKSHDHEVWWLWWDLGLTLMMRSYTYGEVLHLWWGLTLMMRSYNHDGVLRSWWSHTIKMRSYDHNKVLRSWWGLANTRSYIHIMLREDLQLWSATFLVYVSFSV